MVYQGSKNRLSKHILPIIHNLIEKNNIKNYYEPFVGGANIIDKVKCDNKYGYDSNEYLISLLKYIQKDNAIIIAPEQCDIEHYKQVRDAYNRKDYSEFSKEYISLIGYCASYGGRFFDGGYAKDGCGVRNMYQERLRNLKRQAPNLANINFDCMTYDNLNPNDFNNCLFYMDPPYRNTSNYHNQTIDYDKFYQFCKQLAKNNTVLISEYYMPDDFECVWQRDRKILLSSSRENGFNAVEKLYIA